MQILSSLQWHVHGEHGQSHKAADSPRVETSDGLRLLSTSAFVNPALRLRRKPGSYRREEKYFTSHSHNCMQTVSGKRKINSSITLALARPLLQNLKVRGHLFPRRKLPISKPSSCNEPVFFATVVSVSPPKSDPTLRGCPVDEEGARSWDAAAGFGSSNIHE